MTKNMGTTDRALRTLVAVAIAVLYFMHVISGTVAILLGIVAVAFLVTSFIGWCPSYVPFGLSTAKPADVQTPTGPRPGAGAAKR